MLSTYNNNGPLDGAPKKIPKAFQQLHPVYEFQVNGETITLMADFSKIHLNLHILNTIRMEQHLWMPNIPEIIKPNNPSLTLEVTALTTLCCPLPKIKCKSSAIVPFKIIEIFNPTFKATLPNPCEIQDVPQVFSQQEITPITTLIESIQLGQMLRNFLRVTSTPCTRNCLLSGKMILQGTSINNDTKQEMWAIPRLESTTECIIIIKNSHPLFAFLNASLTTTRIEEYFELPKFEQTSYLQEQLISAKHDSIGNTNFPIVVEHNFKRDKKDVVEQAVVECQKETKDIVIIISTKVETQGYTTPLNSPRQSKAIADSIVPLALKNICHHPCEANETGVFGNSCDITSPNENLASIPDVGSPSCEDENCQLYDQQVPESDDIDNGNMEIPAETCLHDINPESDFNPKNDDMTSKFTWTCGDEENAETTKILSSCQGSIPKMLGLRLGLSKRQRVTSLHPAYKKFKFEE